MPLQKWALAALLLLPLGVAAEAAPPSAYQVTLGDGLQYTDLKIGTGPIPEIGQTLSLHYVGTLEDGRKFDSSRDRGQPFSYVRGAGEVIRGWEEGVATMKRGGHRLLHVPAALGYGAQGAGNDIPPNAPLNFDIELLDIR